MVNARLLVAGLLAAGALAGCFTVRESEFPETAMSGVPGSVTNLSVEVRGFETTVVDALETYSYSTVYVPGEYGRRFYRPAHVETVQTTTLVPRLSATDVFLRRAKDRLEAAGFLIRAPQPDWVVEAEFSGPFAGERSTAVRALLWLCTVLTYDQKDVVWGAKLKIYDNRTGRLAFVRDYTQRYDVAVWSPIPLFGPLSYDRTDTGHGQMWCLGALTDRVTADASAFLAGRRGPVPDGGTKPDNL